MRFSAVGRIGAALSRAVGVAASVPSLLGRLVGRATSSARETPARPATPPPAAPPPAAPPVAAPVVTPAQPGPPTARAPFRAAEIAPVVKIDGATAQTRVQRAFASTVTGAAGASDPKPDVVWVVGDNELLVRPSKTRVVFRPGFVLVGIAVRTEQTGDVEIVVPFAVGSAEDPLGVVMATETLPRGPAVIVETWGEPLIAAAWDALLRVAADAASAAGVDEDHRPLVPMALHADATGLGVTPQARHAFDRPPR